MAQVKDYYEKKQEKILAMIQDLKSYGFEVDNAVERFPTDIEHHDFYHHKEDILLSIFESCPEQGQHWKIIAMKGLGIPKCYKSITEFLHDHDFIDEVTDCEDIDDLKDNSKPI